ncbi:YkyA family protein [Lacticaseibacillus paracasei]|uniref:YkyA family protein n=1 Tax=Lacticaseibacillus paracasei TaxID=1597 RepID=UPI0025A2AA89|nr:YkyA family protein [Lacticaseibacillus paracasei]MDM7532552.1 YkyA family protein [Lacticaseibacillus paracasei]
MKKLLILLASLAVLIVGCSATLNPKSQLKTTTATVQTQVQQEQDALKTIGSTVNAFPSAFEKAYQENLQTDLKKENGPVKKLLDRRAAAFKSLEAANSALVGANNTLTKLNNQPSEDTPQTQLNNVLTSLKLAKLDHKTLVSYYREMLTAEDTFFSTTADSDTSQDDLESQISQLNQYYSSLNQQIDVMTANLTTVTSQTTKLAKAIKSMRD